MKSGSYDVPPLLWGDWRCTTDPRMYVADCVVCGGEVWIHRRGYDDWRAVCMDNACAREAMDAAAGERQAEQRRRYEYEAELKATMEPDDPFYGIAATRYIGALTGQEPTRGTWFRCPFHSDGKERTPSLHVTELLPPRWYCHACDKGGTIYDFGALLWGIEPRAEGFQELRDRLARTLLGAAL